MVNKVIEIDGAPKKKRILYIDEAANKVVAINIEGKGCAPKVFAHSSWVALVKAEKLAEREDPYEYMGRIVTPSMVKRIETAWSVIETMVSYAAEAAGDVKKALIDGIPAIFNAKERRKQIEEKAVESSFCADVCRNYLVEFWQRGNTPAALGGMRHKAGAKGRTKVSFKVGKDNEDDSTPQKKKGTPRTVTPGTGMNITPGIIKLIAASARTWSRRGKKISLNTAYLHMLRTGFPLAVKKFGDKIKIVNPDGIPTFDQFKYWHKIERAARRDAKKELAKEYADQAIRPLLGNSTFEAIGPGFRYQIDATVVDIYLVSRYNRQKIVGRPVLYIVIDVWTRMIVGIHIGFNAPSWETAMMAMLNITEDKVEFCKKYGIHIEPHEWPNSPLPEKLLGDRGEILSAVLDRIALLLNIRVENAAPYRGDWKGIVERMFGLVHGSLIEAPGFMEKKYRKRGADDYRLDAALDINEFTANVLDWVIEHNNTTVHGYPLDRRVVNAGVSPIPTQLWAWGVKHAMGPQRHFTREQLLYALLPRGKAKIGRHGVTFEKRGYVNKDLVARGEFSKYGDKKVEVEVSYYSGDLSVILLHDKVQPERFIVCELKPYYDDVEKTLGIEEVQEAEQAKTALERAKYIDDLEYKLTRQQRTTGRNKNAKKEQKAQGPTSESKSSRTSGIADNRKTEVAISAAIETSPIRELAEAITPEPGLIPVPETPKAPTSAAELNVPTHAKLRKVPRDPYAVSSVWD